MENHFRCSVRTLYLRSLSTICHTLESSLFNQLIHSCNLKDYYTAVSIEGINYCCIALRYNSTHNFVCIS